MNIPWEGTELCHETIKECTSKRGADITEKLGGGCSLDFKGGGVFFEEMSSQVIIGDGKGLAICLTVCRRLDRLTKMGSKIDFGFCKTDIDE